METILEKPHASIHYDAERGFIRTTWTDATAELTSEQYREVLTAVADAVCEHDIAGVVADERHMQSRMQIEEDDWRLEFFVPRLNRHVRRFAWVAGDRLGQLPAKGQPFRGEEQEYHNRWFRDLADAEAWAAGEA